MVLTKITVSGGDALRTIGMAAPVQKTTTHTSAPDTSSMLPTAWLKAGSYA
jgi:hypothetical protein